MPALRELELKLGEFELKLRGGPVWLKLRCEFPILLKLRGAVERAPMALRFIPALALRPT